MSLSFLKSSTLAAVASLTLAACSNIATFTGTSGAQVTEKLLYMPSLHKGLVKPLAPSNLKTVLPAWS